MSGIVEECSFTETVKLSVDDRVVFVFVCLGVEEEECSYNYVPSGSTQSQIDKQDAFRYFLSTQSLASQDADRKRLALLEVWLMGIVKEELTSLPSPPFLPHLPAPSVPCGGVVIEITVCLSGSDNRYPDEEECLFLYTHWPEEYIWCRAVGDCLDATT
ncbi:hypothetical protein INR49_024092 [Caranx melampygus]|nr:hypothetical protein INR49_024092 [Caranx melampygus]